MTNDTTYKSIKPASVDSPVVVKRIPAISQVSAGSTHSLFLTKDGVVFGCGMNNHYEMGDFGGTQGNNIM